MLYRTVYLCLAAAALAAPTSNDVVPLEKQQPTVIPILSQSEEIEANGTYKFSYETANGIKREETSFDKVVPKVEGRSAGGKDGNEGGEDEDSNEIHVQQGSYSYTAPDGTIISLRYIADENGFRPIGDHLPKAPALLIAALAASSAEKSNSASDSIESGSAPVPLTRSLPTSNSSKPESEKASTSKAPESVKPEEIKIEKVNQDHPTTESSETVAPTTAEVEQTTKSESTATTESTSSSEEATTAAVTTTAKA